jgi:hypothetical protein
VTGGFDVDEEGDLSAFVVGPLHAARDNAASSAPTTRGNRVFM